MTLNGRVRRVLVRQSRRGEASVRCNKVWVIGFGVMGQSRCVKVENGMIRSSVVRWGSTRQSSQAEVCLGWLRLGSVRLGRSAWRYRA